MPLKGDADNWKHTKKLLAEIGQLKAEREALLGACQAAYALRTDRLTLPEFIRARFDAEQQMREAITMATGEDPS